MSAKQLNVIAWGLSVTAGLVAAFAWGQDIQWGLSGLSTYRLFPLFGLLAFSIMWSHYIASALRQYLRFDKAVLNTYFETSSLAVLVAILLHPGLLIWQLWRDGEGLPPTSTWNYVGSSLKAVVTLGTISLLIFLAYEFRRKFAERPWWEYVQYTSDAAMLVIFYHAVKLGGQLQNGWFRAVWLFYGITFIGSLIYIYGRKIKTVQPRS